MPDPLTFCNSFGIHKNKTYVGYQLIDIEATHKAVVRYYEYNYHIVLTYKIVSPEISPKEFFENHIFDDKNVSTRYGSNYLCHLEKYSYRIEDNHIIIILSGYSIRKD